jgi:hypothetical protein
MEKVIKASLWTDNVIIMQTSEGEKTISTGQQIEIHEDKRVEMTGKTFDVVTTYRIYVGDSAKAHRCTSYKIETDTARWAR